MVAVRRLSVSRFRGFEQWSTGFPEHAVLVGEPGAGRSDLIEILIRLLDPEYLRTHRGEELDFWQLSIDEPATAEAVLGGLSDAQARALIGHWEWWDPAAETLITQSGALEPVGLRDQERVVRIAYRLAAREDGRFEERVYWPKSSNPDLDQFDPVRTAERAYLPFFWQRGLSTRPLDLAGRGELRDLVERQGGERFDEAVQRFVTEVSTASARFSEQERVKAALESVLAPLRDARRFKPDPAEQLVRFLPDGGSPSGLLRTLTAAITMEDGPDHLPAVRHGATVLGALRAGALIAAAESNDGSIVAVDDFGGEFDPHLAADVARRLRAQSGQLILATRSPTVVDTFRIPEIVRVFRADTQRRVARGSRGATKSERISAYFYAGRLTRALGASAVVVVDGVHDRLALESVERRATSAGTLQSLAAAGIAYVDAAGSGELAKVANAARQLGLYVVVLLDNDQSAGEPPNAATIEAATQADVALRLPPRRKLEWLLVDGIGDTELLSAVKALTESMTDLRVPATWEALAGQELQRFVVKLLHDTKGSIHAAFVEALDDAAVCPTAVSALERIRSLAVGRASTGLVDW